MVAGRFDRRAGFHRYHNSYRRPSPSPPSAVPSLGSRLVGRSSSSSAAMGMGPSRRIWLVRMGSRTIRWRPCPDPAIPT